MQLCCFIEYLENYPSFSTIRQIGSPGCSMVGMSRVWVFWTLYATWNVVVDLNGFETLIARNRTIQYLNICKISCNCIPMLGTYIVCHGCSSWLFASDSTQRSPTGWTIRIILQGLVYAPLAEHVITLCLHW